MDDFKEVLGRIDIVAHISSLTGQQPKKLGSVYGLPECPFDDCGSKKGFRIWPAVQGWKCYACSRSGNALTFTKEYKGLSWYETLQDSAAAIGYQLTSNGSTQKQCEADETRQAIFNAAADLYHQRLLETPAAIKVLEQTRGYDLETIKAWKIGYSGGKFNLLKSNLIARFPEKDLLNSGLLVLRKQYQLTPTVFEQLRLLVLKRTFPDELLNILESNPGNRLGETRFLEHISNIAPGISGDDKKTVLQHADTNNGDPSDFFIPELFIFPHFAGRNVGDFSAKDSKKHLKPKGTDINYRLKKEFRLNNILFYNQDAFYSDEIILVEGQHDAIQASRAQGKKNAVAITGQFSPEQLEFLKRINPEKTVYTAFDPDPEGYGYTDEVFKLLWGKCKLRSLNWENKSWDIEEYLRKSSDAGKAIKRLLSESEESFRFVINNLVPEIVDIDRQIEKLKPYTDKLAEIEDDTTISICIENIKARFDDPSVARIIADRVRKQKQRVDYSSKERLPVWEEDGIYKFSLPNGSIKRLSNFRIIIQDRVFFEGSFKYKCTLINNRGTSAEDIEFDARERSNLHSFKEVCQASGAYYFYGKPEELTAVWEYVDQTQSSAHSIYIQGLGWVKKKNIWIFGNCAIRDNEIYPADDNGLIKIDKVNYKIDGVNVYGGDIPTINLETEYTSDFIRSIAIAFNRLLDVKDDNTLSGYSGLLLLGFVPATLYSHEIVRAVNCFPYLFFYGLPGTGKSASLSLLMKCFGFAGYAEPFSDQTSPGFYQAMGQLSNLPFYTTEFDPDKFKHLEATFKSAYHRNSPGKGDPKKQRLNYVINGVSWIDGNHLPESDAMLERLVTFSLFRKPNRGRREAFDFLQENGQDLSVLMRQLILEKTSDNIDLLIKKIKEIREHLTFAHNFDLRTSLNHAIPAAALHLIKDINIPKDFLEWLSDHIRKSLEHNEKSDPVVSFFSRMSYLYMEGDLQTSIAFRSGHKDLIGEFMYINIKTVYLSILEDLRKKGQSPNYNSQYIRDALCNSDSLVDRSFNTRIFSKQNNCIVLDMSMFTDVIRLEIEPMKDRYYEKYLTENEALRA